MEKLLLHVCCGPCALEPYRILAQKYNVIIMYSNDNIYPKEEFKKRKDTLVNWANNQGIEVIVDQYNSYINKLPMGKYRCSKCYEHRLKKAACFAKAHNIKNLSSSLAVSPYQHSDILHEKLIEVCNMYNLNPIFIDFRPYYKNAVEKSIELGMYRQKYCGCKKSLEVAKNLKNQKKLNAAKQLEKSRVAKEKHKKIIEEKTRRKRLLKEYRNKTSNL